LDAVIEWLLASDEPWTRYRARLDLLGESPSDSAVLLAQQELNAHPQVNSLLACLATWGQFPLKRHTDAGYSLYALSTLADFGLNNRTPGMAEVMQKILLHQSNQGGFQTLVNIPRSFGGSGEDDWAWMACDAPTLLYILLAMGMSADSRVQKAVAHLTSLVDENGWRCKCAPELGKFRGPGRKTDPCPIANLLALKALACLPEFQDSQAVHAGAEMLLAHWADSDHSRPYLFGAGTDFRKLKYPFIWYDILHVTDVLSRFPFVHHDTRFLQMIEVLTAQADPQGRYTATSMYQSWKGWPFADKKNPSPWLTFLVRRTLKRIS
jgi:hypothetical protein